MDLLRLAATLLQQPGNHVGETSAVVRKFSLPDLPTRIVVE
jgi:hypothetical protein